MPPRPKPPRQPSASDQVRAAIRASGLSAYALGQLAGVSRSTVCDFLDGERSLSLATLDKLMPHLGLKVTYPARTSRR